MSKNLELTTQQYKTLIEVAFIGEWVLNGTKIDDELEQDNRNAEGLLNYILSKAPKFGLSKMVKNYPDGDVEVTPEAEIEFVSKIDEFVNDGFYDTLLDKLVFTELVKKYGELGLKGMSEEEIFDVQSRIYEEYERIFEQKGLGAIKIEGVN